MPRPDLDTALRDLNAAAHAHNRALRYMTKRLLRDLYRAWRAA